MKILEQLNPNNTISFSRPLAHALGLNEAVVYSALISKQAYYAQRGMLDSEGYFFSTVADLQESTTLSKRRQCAAIKALVAAGLIECKKRGMPARRYFRVCDQTEPLLKLLEKGKTAMEELNPISQKPRESEPTPSDENAPACRDENALSCQNENAPTCRTENAPQEVTKRADKWEQNETYTINPKRNKSKVINPNQSIHGDGIDTMDNSAKRSEYLEIIHENIGYESLREKEKVDELVEIMLDVICSRKSAIRVNGEDLPKEAVKSRFLRIDDSHIGYVLDSLRKNTSAVRNIRAYLITALYNAPATIDSYYIALVNHDLNEMNETQWENIFQKGSSQKRSTVL